MRNFWTRSLAIGAVVALTIGVVATLIETDEEAIERLVEDCRMAVLARDVERLLGVLESGATAGGLVGDGPLAPKVHQWVSRESEDLADLSVRCREIVVEEETARGEWRAVAVMKPGSIRPRYVAMVRVEFSKGPSGWRVHRVWVGRP